MTSWIVPSNIANYDVSADFRRYGKVNWFQNTSIKNLKIGDTVYIYLSSPIREIKWKCVVNDVNYYLQENDEFTHSYDNNEVFADGPFVELEPVFEFSIANKTAYYELKNHGLKSRLMGPQRVDSTLLQYLLEVEQLQSDPNSHEKYIQTLSIIELRKAIERYSVKNIKNSKISIAQYSRSPYVSQFAKTIANGKCQLCGLSAPFNDLNGQPYLESHHIIWLSKGGADTIDNVVALCPNCHRKMHIVNDKKDIKFLLKQNKLR